MGILLQCVSSAQHEDHGVKVDNRLLHGDPSYTEDIAQHYYKKRHHYHRQRKPAYATAYYIIDSIN